MKRDRKILYAIIPFVVMLIILAACGGSPEEATAVPTEAPTKVVAEDVEEEAVEEAEEPTEPEEQMEEEPMVSNAVRVEDQNLGSDQTIMVASVTADVDSWIVVHAQEGGRPGPVIGQAFVGAGESENVAVEIDASRATETLYAMLHVDEGTSGEYEFPGDDIPAEDADGNVVTPSFALTYQNQVIVEDQPLGAGAFITVTEVSSTGPGWMVIHAQNEDRPGAILGLTQVGAGVSENLAVELDAAGVTGVLYAMLHVDAGTLGEFDFPGGDDVPAVDQDGSVVTPPFNITGSLPNVVSLLLAESDELGVYLTDAEGYTLYTFAFDVPGTSNCYDRCAGAWPPFFVNEGDILVGGEGVPGELRTTLRDDGKLMVTYNNWPLYYWINDEAPGDTTGHNVNNVWAVAYPYTQVFLGGNDELGSFLVDGAGMTLYRFNPDLPGQSNCSGGCAEAWPPLLLDEGESLGFNAGVIGPLGTTQRDDGTTQITYDGMPLYLWQNDQAPGDTTGHGVNDVWFVVPPYTVRLGRTDDLGEFLVGANGMTLYLFTIDDEGRSNCYDECAVNWPPLLVQEGEIPVPGEGVIGELGVSQRDDGSFQVTYKDLPLYFWIRDEAPGDTTGHGVNDVWFVVEP